MKEGHILYYEGKLIDEMMKEELIEALKNCYDREEAHRESLTRRYKALCRT